MKLACQVKPEGVKLNDEQTAAVQSTAKRKIIVAGPGSGKTATLVAAIGHALPVEFAGNIAVVTYTTAAAAELAQRLRKAGHDYELGFCGTLHALCLKLVREHPEACGFAPGTRFAVMDDDSKEAAVEEIMAEMGVKCSAKKVLPLLPQLCGVNTRGNVSPTKEELVAIEYNQRARRSGLLDFDQILYYGTRVAQTVKPFTHLFVDEAQDASLADWSFYESGWEHLTMVGDGDQSIYGFRGGNPARLVQHADLAGNPKAVGALFQEVHILDRCYRCTFPVAAAAQALIEHNTGRVSKEIRTDKQGLPVAVIESANADLERQCLAASINAEINHGTKPTDIAVLCRKNWLAQEISAHLKSCGVPVAERTAPPSPGGDWARAKALLPVLADPANDAAVLAYLALTRGPDVASSTSRLAKIAMVSVNEHLGHRFGRGGEPSDLFALMAREGISMESRDRLAEATKELAAYKNPISCADMALFLSAREEGQRELTPGVTVCTAHASKGREFPVVFIAGCEQGEFPTTRKDSDEQEERRLFFVAMTRASERLVLSWAAERPQRWSKFNKPEKRERSRFIQEAGL